MYSLSPNFLCRLTAYLIYNINKFNKFDTLDYDSNCDTKYLMDNCFSCYLL